MKFLCLAGLVILLATGSLSASVVACPTSTTMATLETFDTPADACFSQDKLFYGFNYTATGAASPAASDVTASLILQTSPALDIHGWNFDGNWIQTGTELAGFTLGYTTEFCAASPCTTGNPGEYISGADATYAPVSKTVAGNETVNWSNGTTGTLTDLSPGPIPADGDIGLSPGFLGPISVSASFAGTGGITQTSLRFYETTPSAVPEPRYLGFLLGALGLAAIARFGLKKRAA